MFLLKRLVWFIFCCIENICVRKALQGFWKYNTMKEKVTMKVLNSYKKRTLTARFEYQKWEVQDMARTVAIGIQDFEKIRMKNCFYVDKTMFIKEWWEGGDEVTLITRPRRFGKTLNMSMLEKFFSLDYAGRGELFEGLDIWKEEEYRKLQGTYPVIALSFANIKGTTYKTIREKICLLVMNLFSNYDFLRESGVLNEAEKDFFRRVMSSEATDSELAAALHQLSCFLYRYYGKKVLIFLDEYDTPMQEAYLGGCWKEMVELTRGIFNSAFKTNPYMERAVMTGITRVSKESIFSDLNHLEVVTCTSDKYATAFGFTEEEVFASLEECGLAEEKAEVKHWYDGFVFGEHRDIYNPWSILNFLDKRKYGAYWANTSTNGLVSRLLQEGSRGIKEQFEALLKGETLKVPIDEQIVYNQLGKNDAAVWSLLLASGYFKVLDYQTGPTYGIKRLYELDITNFETRCMFEEMVLGWFEDGTANYNDFVKAMLLDDLDMMNRYMRRVSMHMFSYFDTGSGGFEAEPERFYHGFVLGLLVDLRDKYIVTSNRESGFGRYDVMLEPKDIAKNAGIIIEFKVMNERREATLEDTVAAALKQIEEKQYEAQLIERGVPAEQIRKYGFAFCGKEVLIGSSAGF